MSTQNNNNNDKSNIEKFEGSFQKEELGVTIVVNKSINDLTNVEALGLYVYLLARPPGWKINPTHLRLHFNICRKKIYSLLNYLLEKGYLSREQKRTKGVFSTAHYKVHLHSNHEKSSKNDVEINSSTNQAGIEFSPCAILGDAVKWHAYKTKNLKNKENKKEKINKKEKSHGAKAHISGTNISKPQTHKTTPAIKSLSDAQTLQMMLADNPFEIEQAVLEDWMIVRKQKRAVITNTAWKRVLTELEKCRKNGLDAKECFAKVVGAGWQSFKMEWFMQQDKPFRDEISAKNIHQFYL